MDLSSSVRRRWGALSRTRRDLVLAVLLTAAVNVELVLAGETVEGPRLLQHVAFTALTGAVAARRRAPVLAAVGVGVGLGGQTVIGTAPVASGYIALFIVVYSVATYATRRRDAVLGLAALLAGIAVYPFTVDDVKPADELVNAMIPTVVWALARVARERQERAVEAERLRLMQAAEAARLQREALAGERRRIARELHDTVAHGVTLMLLQSELLRDRPGDEAVVDVVQQAGRACLDDLRTLLVVLREEEGGARTAGSVDVPGLVRSAADSGLTVRLTQPDEMPQLSATLDATVFRVVQEGLTNAMRHAPGAAVDVVWDVVDGELEVRVEDDGGRASVPVQRGSGHGLLGIRERVALLGGTIAAAQRDDGPGWRVRVRLPLERSERSCR